MTADRTDIDRELAGVHASWERFGEVDAMWAVHSDPARSNGAWEAAEFFASGPGEVTFTLGVLTELGATARGRALDFGCGLGRITQALAREFDTVVGVDVASSMIEQARAHDRSGGRVTYVQNVEPHLQRFDDASFDLVYSKLVLQHIPPVLSRSYLGELARLVAPGGALVVQTPSAFYGGSLLAETTYRSETIVTRAPAQMRWDERVTLDATVRNCSEEPWRCSEADLAVGAYWQADDGARVNGTEARTLLGADIAPGESRAVTLTVPRPPALGRVHLVVDVVQEGVTWFGEHAGRAAVVDIDVKPRRLSDRVRDRIARSARAPGHADRGPAPAMPMYGLDDETVEQTITAAGLTIVRRSADHAAPGWHSATWYATRASA